MKKIVLGFLLGVVASIAAYVSIVSFTSPFEMARYIDTCDLPEALDELCIRTIAQPTALLKREIENTVYEDNVMGALERFSDENYKLNDYKFGALEISKKNEFYLVVHPGNKVQKPLNEEPKVLDKQPYTISLTQMINNKPRLIFLYDSLTQSIRYGNTYDENFPIFIDSNMDGTVENKITHLDEIEFVGMPEVFPYLVDRKLDNFYYLYQGKWRPVIKINELPEKYKGADSAFINVDGKIIEAPREK